MTTFSSALLDSNVLIYALDKLSPHHSHAKNVVQEAMSGKFQAYLTNQNIVEFLSIVTNKKRVSQAISQQLAWREINKYLHSDNVNIIQPNDRTIPIFEELLVHWDKKSPNHIFDLHLIATIFSHDIDTIITANVQDFQPIPGLNVVGLDQQKS